MTLHGGLHRVGKPFPQPCARLQISEDERESFRRGVADHGACELRPPLSGGALQSYFKSIRSHARARSGKRARGVAISSTQTPGRVQSTSMDLVAPSLSDDLSDVLQGDELQARGRRAHFPPQIRRFHRSSSRRACLPVPRVTYPSCTQPRRALSKPARTMRGLLCSRPAPRAAAAFATQRLATRTDTRRRPSGFMGRHKEELRRDLLEQ